uniref:Uncharacterized protein n=1 Tax=Salix viminalis TaxID=40686 RepID=A0A6N2JYZ9_SALVM
MGPTDIAIWDEICTTSRTGVFTSGICPSVREKGDNNVKGFSFCWHFTGLPQIKYFWNGVWENILRVHGDTYLPSRLDILWLRFQR